MSASVFDSRESGWWEGDEDFYPGCYPVNPPSPAVAPPRISDFHILGSAGKSTYGEVVIASKYQSGRLVCLKVFDKKRLVNRNSVHGIVKELNAFKRIASRPHSSFLLEASACFQDSDHVFMALVCSAVSVYCTWSFIQCVDSSH